MLLANNSQLEDPFDELGTPLDTIEEEKFDFEASPNSPDSVPTEVRVSLISNSPSDINSADF
jgi:hypothetical protein